MTTEAASDDFLKHFIDLREGVRPPRENGFVVVLIRYLDGCTGRHSCNPLRDRPVMPVSCTRVSPVTVPFTGGNLPSRIHEIFVVCVELAYNTAYEYVTHMYMCTDRTKKITICLLGLGVCDNYYGRRQTRTRVCLCIREPPHPAVVHSPTRWRRRHIFLHLLSHENIITRSTVVHYFRDAFFAVNLPFVADR